MHTPLTATRPLLLLEGAECCAPRSNLSIGFLQQHMHLASSCQCAQRCAEAAGCSHFTHSAQKAICNLCSSCVHPRDPHPGDAQSASFTSWQLGGDRSSNPVSTELLIGKAQPTARTACPKASRSRKKAPNAAAQGTLSPGVAEFLLRESHAEALGTAVHVPRATCSNASMEEQIFRATCEPLIKRMDAFLERTRASKRGLIFKFVGSQWGRSDIGWGHALPAAIVLHWLCWQANRYCFVRLHDYDLGDFWGYGNGETWSAPRSKVWPSAMSITMKLKRLGSHRNVTGSNFFKEPWRNTGLMEELAARLRDHEAPLLQVEIQGSLPFASADWIPKLPVRSTGRTIDRCFCRYVTQPRFLGLLPPHALQQAPPAAYHFRTGLADVPDEALMAPTEDPACQAQKGVTAASNAAGWLASACTKSSNVVPGSYIMSDAPSLTTASQAVWPGLSLRANPVSSMGHLASTRSWRFSRATGGQRLEKLYLSADFYIAGLASAVYTTQSSSLVMAVLARSMCISQVGFIDDADGPCPEFGATFERDMVFKFDTARDARSARSAYKGLLCRFGSRHPCRGLNLPHECREAFVAALRARSPTLGAVK